MASTSSCCSNAKSVLVSQQTIFPQLTSLPTNVGLPSIIYPISNNLPEGYSKTSSLSIISDTNVEPISSGEYDGHNIRTSNSSKSKQPRDKSGRSNGSICLGVHMNLSKNQRCPISLKLSENLHLIIPARSLQIFNEGRINQLELQPLNKFSVVVVPLLLTQNIAQIMS